MAEIRVKRVASMSPAYLKSGELGVAGDYLYFGRYQAGDSTISATKIALQDISNNVFTNINTFKNSNDGINAIEFQDAGGSTKYYLKAGRLATDLTSFNDADLVNKLYVDGLIQGLDIKASVKVATTEPLIGTYSTTPMTFTLTATGPLVIDGYTTALNDRILVKNQGSTGTENYYNGIYYVSTAGTTSVSAVLTRAADANSIIELVNAFVFVEQGDTLGDTGWVCTVNSDGVLTGSIPWTQFSGAGTYSAGSGLTLTGNTFSLAQIATLTVLANLTAGTATPSAVAVLDSTTAAALGTNQSFVTERDVYYGLPTINNSHSYNSSTTIYAPSAGGTSGWILQAAGATATPGWTSSLGATQGGTGQTTYVVGDVLYSSATNALSRLAIGTAGKFIRSNGTTPTWSTLTIPDTLVASSILATSKATANALTAITASTNSLQVLQSNSGTISFATASGTGNPVYNISPTFSNAYLDHVSESATSASTNLYFIGRFASADFTTALWMTHTGDLTWGSSGKIYHSGNFAVTLNNASSTNATFYAPTVGGTSGWILQAAGATSTPGWTSSLGATQGGTGNTTYVVGDLLYASATNALSRLASVTTGYFLRTQGTGTAPTWSAFSTLTIGTGLTAAGNYDPITARTISLTAITAGDAIVGAVRYNSTTKTAGQWYGGSTNPSSSNRLNYDGILYATYFEGIIDGGVWT